MPADLQRACGGLRHARCRTTAGTGGPTRPPPSKDLLARYVDCTERVDLHGLAALLHPDARFLMPPLPGTWTGKEAVVRCWAEGGFGSDTFGSVRCVTTRANGAAAVAVYVRVPGAPTTPWRRPDPQCGAAIFWDFLRRREFFIRVRQSSNHHNQ